MSDTLPAKDDLERLAKDLALELHEGQWYDEARGIPYSEHLADAVAVLKRFGFDDEDLLAAEWLHDAIEDSADREQAHEYITAHLGKGVADLVWAVTDGEGKNRRERHEASFAKMEETPRAIIVKLGDRIANVEAGVKMGKHGLVKMYRKEWPEFYDRLYGLTPGTEAMWRYLESLLAPGGRHT